MTHKTSFKRHDFNDGGVCYTHYMPSTGRITVVDRMTGFGWRDVETGYLCPSGQFWLACGGVDIRDALQALSSDGEMAEWVIARADNCTGGNHPKRAGRSLEWLIDRDSWKPPTGAQP